MEVEAARTSGRGCCRHCCWGLARQPLSKELAGPRQAKELAGAVLTMGLRTYYGPTTYYGLTMGLLTYSGPTIGRTYYGPAYLHGGTLSGYT